MDGHYLGDIVRPVPLDDSGELLVKAVSPQASSLTQANIKAGDALIQIEGTNPAPYTLTVAARALSGRPGTTKKVVIRRDGERIATTVTVAHIL